AKARLTGLFDLDPLNNSQSITLILRTELFAVFCYQDFAVQLQVSAVKGFAASRGGVYISDLGGSLGNHWLCNRSSRLWAGERCSGGQDRKGKAQGDGAFHDVLLQ